MPDKRKKQSIIYIAVGVILVAALAAFAIMAKGPGPERSGAERIVAAVPYTERVEDFKTNYYTRWLEDRTGYDIDFVFLEEGYERESLDALLSSADSGVDAVLFPNDREIMSPEDYLSYVNQGLITAPADHLEADSNLSRIADDHPEADLKCLSAEDGRLFCFPSVNMSRTSKNAQILWINIDWLKNLGLTVPRTTEEFKKVLTAFSELDPNGNGINDELPLLSCDSEEAFQSERYLMNSFKGHEAEGEAYIRELIGSGLIVTDCRSYNQRQLMELVNDPSDTVGAFSSHSIADVVYSNNPDVLAHFVQLAPLSSAYQDEGIALRTDVIPVIGGIIPANSAHKKAAASVMDAMLSEEASLIALYGEEGVDWRFSSDGELSTFGTRARITTIHYFKGERQNKNYAGVGPLLAASEYTDGVTWNGDHSMTEYIDARAVKAYEVYYE